MKLCGEQGSEARTNNVVGNVLGRRVRVVSDDEAPAVVSLNARAGGPSAGAYMVRRWICVYMILWDMLCSGGAAQVGQSVESKRHGHGHGHAELITVGSRRQSVSPSGGFTSWAGAGKVGLG